MSRNLKKIWPALLFGAVLMGVGGMIGFFARPHLVVEPAGDTTEDDSTSNPHGSSSIVELTESAIENMELETGKLDERDVFQRVQIPAAVVERLPRGRREITAPVGGSIEKVLIAPGQAVTPGQPLFELRVTDEQLSVAQVGLLDVISEIEVAEKRLARLEPLAKSGSIAGSRLLDIQFDLKRLNAKREALLQELSLRGLSQRQIDGLLEHRQLLKRVTVIAPPLEESSELANDDRALKQNNADSQSGSVTQTSLSTSQPQPQIYTVESIAALAGANLRRGNQLCELTHHGQLLIKGFAFESDVEKIATANSKGWAFSAEFGEAPANFFRHGLALHSIDNHVDDQSQTYPVYVAIDNEIVSDSRDRQDRRYVHWQLKPGQRSHLHIPIRYWENQLVAPNDAVAHDGVEAFVFRKLNHSHVVDGVEIFEFQRVPVKVLYSDNEFSVLARDLRLDKYATYALSHAYQLNLALKQAASGGGGHSHDHEH